MVVQDGHFTPIHTVACIPCIEVGHPHCSHVPFFPTFSHHFCVMFLYLSLPLGLLLFYALMMLAV